MKFIFTLVIAVSLNLFSTNLFADLKRITCKVLVQDWFLETALRNNKEHGGDCKLGSVLLDLQFDVDTDDFGKENPMYELSVDSCSGYQKNKYGQQTKRMPFEVTATTLSFRLSEAKTIGSYTVPAGTMHLNRDSLMLSGPGGPPCEISDIERKNKI